MANRASRRHATLPSRAACKSRAAAELISAKAPPIKATSSPANRKGALAGRENEIARLYAGGKGRRLSSIARTFGVSHNAIRKCLGLPRRATNRLTKRRSGGRRDATCSLCGGSIPNNGSATASACRACVDKYFPTVWSRDRGDDEADLPRNLRPYLQG
jgi:hypothetical protein